jgi:N-acetylneuraminate synthase
LISEIVAEIGSNWETKEHALASIDAAAAAGATAAKFQAFTCDALFGMPFEFIDSELGHGEVAACGVYNSTLPLAWLPDLAHRASERGISFLCTAFSPALLAAVDPYVPAHKIASSDLCYPQLLQAAAATGKPIYLSTGAATEDEIAQALACLGPKASAKTTLLYCVAAYPARTTNTDALFTLKERFGLRVGISDHSREIIETAVNAQRARATVIEKHFTAFPELETPDRPHSLTADEFKMMVSYIRAPRHAALGPTFEEVDMLTMHKRRLIATRAVAVGEKLVYGENFGAYRSLAPQIGTTSPFLWEDFEGRPAARAIARGHALTAGDIAHG